MSGSAVGKIKASRVNNLDAAEYVGPQGQMWYDVDTGLLRLGDDVTPGGIVVGGGGGNGSPGGPNHSIQFNNAGTFGGGSGLTTDGANITATGNVRAAYFLGDGSQLTNLPVSDYGNANVAEYLPTYTGNLTPSNILTDNYLYANGQPFTPGTNYSNANVASYLPTYTGNLAGGNISVTGFLYGNGAFLTGITGGSGNYSNANVANYLPTYSGNLTAGNAVITGNLLVQGTTVSVNTTSLTVDNVAITVGDTTTVPSALNNAGILVGNNQSGNTAVASWLYNYSSNSWTTLLNISSPTITALTSSTTGLTSNVASLAGVVYGNANVQAYLPTYTGLLTNLANVFSVGNISTGTYFIGNAAFVTGVRANILTGNTLSSNVTLSSLTQVGTLANLSVTGNVATSGNLLTTSQISATGNITTAGYFIGNFAGNISGNIVVPGANTQVLYNNNGNAGASSAFAFDYATNVMSVGGNIAATNILTNNYLYANGQPFTPGTNYSNANVETYLPTYSGNVGNLSTTGYIFGNGAFLTGITAGGNYSNANVANYLPTYSGAFTAATVTTTGNISGSYILGNGSQLSGMYSNVNVQAFLPIYSGNLGYIQNLTVTGSATAAGNIAAGQYFIGNGSQLTGMYGNTNVASYLPTYTGNIAGGNISITGKITGNGSGLTGIVGANVTGTVPQAAYAASSFSATAAVTANTANSATTATTAGTVTTNAQPNITSVGTLTTLSVTGALNAGNITGNGAGLTGLPAQRACVTSNITSLTAGYAINIAADYGNAQWPAGIFTIYQTAQPAPTITLTNQWTGTGSTSKNAYANYAGNVVNLSNVNMTLSLSSGTFNVQSSDNIIIGNTIITGSNVTGLGITGSGGTISVPASLIGNATQIAASSPVIVNLSTNAGGPFQALGDTLTTVAPQPFSLTGITASFPTTTLSIGANSSQPVQYTTTVATGSAISGNIIISGAANSTTSVGTSLTGNTSAINSTAGNFVVTASYLGSGLYGAGNSVATANVSLSPAAFTTPMFTKSTANQDDPGFTTSDTNFGANWQPGPGSPGNTYGILTNYNNPISQFYWLAIPTSTFNESFNVESTFAQSGNGALYFNYNTQLGIVNQLPEQVYGGGTDWSNLGYAGGTYAIGNVPYIALGFTGFANIESPSNPPNVFIYTSSNPSA